MLTIHLDAFLPDSRKPYHRLMVRWDGGSTIRRRFVNAQELWDYVTQFTVNSHDGCRTHILRVHQDSEAN